MKKLHLVSIAALALALSCNFGPWTCNAQPYQLNYVGAFQSQLFGTTNGPLVLSGLNGGTNIISAATTNTYYSAVYYTNTYTTVSVTNVGGLPVFSYTTNSVYGTNVPGVIGLTKYDLSGLEFSGTLCGLNGTTQIPTNGLVQSWWDWSADAANWQSNAFQLNLTFTAAQGLGPQTVCTNLWPLGVGYLRLDAIGITNLTGFFTNVTVAYAKKPIRTGP